MWLAVVLTLCLLANANTYTSRQQRPYSAATEAQIRFAIENNYDDTGPGAKGQEYAYKTYKTLEDALVSYLDDPDTKLPDHEREKALNILELQNQGGYSNPTIRPFPNTVEEYNAYAKQTIPPVVRLNIPNKQAFQHPTSNYGFLNLKDFQQNALLHGSQQTRVNDGYSYQKIQAAKSNPVSLAHYTRGFTGHEQQSTVNQQFDPNPHYSFSYGVHDKQTGDTKSAQETRADGVVRGFYSFIDADGKQRTVHYTADDKEGFKAKVQLTDRTNLQ
ncbi:uncharacterized protein LOC120626858 [Pararge aegeria]|uniref:Jg15571 protein n=1 Tax=Pararge aegeria aegeria TaxID=348720 RepID=A0A8S4RUS7_9NEOP|nr:uncharacterized protein LOC120626858 [Pararge aegeria]CAH2241372.1 jg15571 [Pararge aegeria aegeria]